MSGEESDRRFRVLSSPRVRARRNQISRRTLIFGGAATMLLGLGGWKALEAFADWVKEGPSDAQKEAIQLYDRVEREHPENILKNVVVTGEEDEKGRHFNAIARNKPFVGSYNEEDPNKGKVLNVLDDGLIIPEGILVIGNNPDPRYDSALYLLWSTDPKKRTPENMRFTYEGGLDLAGQRGKVEYFPLASVKLRP